MNRRLFHNSCRAAITIPILLATAIPASAQRIRGSDRERARNTGGVKSAFRDVVTDASHSTVTLKSDGKDAAFGTVISDDGWIITKASELPGAITCIIPGGRTVDAKIVGIAEEDDLALLKVDVKDLTPITWGDATKAQVGQWVATVGTTNVPVAVGVLSVGRRKIPGRSGKLGVALADADGHGAKVMQVLPDSPAEKAGVRVDDIITEINGTAVDNREALVTIVRKFPPGHEVSVTFRRGEKKMEITAKLAGGLGPEAREDAMNRMGGALSERNSNFPAVLQHDTVLTPAQCGGPLVTLDGKAIGINIARAGRVESYVLPADVILALLDDLKSGKRPPAPKPSTRPAGATTNPAEE
ncbi:MAG: hypothetical protein JWP03_2380 [Phycisphaerales bacterium]|nr:hypothetical protein [Phycisphaerales bacterium]